MNFSSCDSFRNSGAESEVAQAQGNRLPIMKVYVPDGFDPGRKLKVRGPDGRKVRMAVPPRSLWSFQNCGGEPRPYFLIKSMGPAAAALNASHSTEP